MEPKFKSTVVVMLEHARIICCQFTTSLMYICVHGRAAVKWEKFRKLKHPAGNTQMDFVLIDYKGDFDKLAVINTAPCEAFHYDFQERHIIINTRIKRPEPAMMS